MVSVTDNLLFIFFFYSLINLKYIIMNFNIFSLKKDFRSRPNYSQLLAHPFCLAHQQPQTALVALFVSEILDLPDLPVSG